MNVTVHVSAAVLQELLAQARAGADEECCGLLAGRAGRITQVFPAPNALASSTAYEIAPADLFRIFWEMRAAGLQHLGIYHSHPSGDNAPSARDLKRAYYPDVAYFIISPQPGASRPVRAFRIRDAAIAELEIATIRE